MSAVKSPASGCGPPGEGSPCQAALWESGTITDLGTLCECGSIAYGINDRGQVVGRSGPHAFVWENGTISDLGTLGGNVNEAHGINNRGQIVGWSAGFGTRGFLWENGKMTDLGSLGADYRGRVFTLPMGINERGQVVGYSDGGDGFSHGVPAGERRDL